MGIITGGSSSSTINYSVTFSKEFVDTNYIITTICLQRYNTSNPSSFYISTRTTTGFSGSFIGAMPDGIDWEVKGFIS